MGYHSSYWPTVGVIWGKKPGRNLMISFRLKGIHNKFRIPPLFLFYLTEPFPLPNPFISVHIILNLSLDSSFPFAFDIV